MALLSILGTLAQIPAGKRELLASQTKLLIGDAWYKNSISNTLELLNRLRDDDREEICIPGVHSLKLGMINLYLLRLQLLLFQI